VTSRDTDVLDTLDGERHESLGKLGAQPTIDFDSQAGLAWLDGVLLAHIERNPGVDEDALIEYVEDLVGSDFKGRAPGLATIDALFHLVLRGVLRWYEQKNKPDAALLYKLKKKMEKNPPRT